MNRDEALAALGLDREASPVAIKKAYYGLCLKHHPDRFSDPKEKAAAAKGFLKIRDAYELLKKLAPAAPPPPSASASLREQDEWDEKIAEFFRTHSARIPLPFEGFLRYFDWVPDWLVQERVSKAVAMLLLGAIIGVILILFYEAYFSALLGL